tara:strand:+ start:102 stop:329 length:228 start_codon:yes stop_codon:yes gene_type:complete
MKPSNIQAGGEYVGGKQGKKRLVRLILRSEDPSAATVKYHAFDGNVLSREMKYCSLSSFARWATKRTKLRDGADK